jgi:hypothetical protein
MDAYRVLGANHPDSTENRLAKTYAEDAIRRGTSYDGTEPGSTGGIGGEQLFRGRIKTV